MKSRKYNSFLFLVVLLTAVVYSCDESLPDPIYGTKPVADFTATQSQSDVFTWSFTNNSTGAVSYNWDFGDGNGSSEANPSHTYTGAGQFTVTLTATAAVQVILWVGKLLLHNQFKLIYQHMQLLMLHLLLT